MTLPNHNDARGGAAPWTGELEEAAASTEIAIVRRACCGGASGLGSVEATAAGERAAAAWQSTRRVLWLGMEELRWREGEEEDLVRFKIRASTGGKI